MYPTSQTWNTLIEQTGHYFETKVRIDGTDYEKDQLISISANYTMFADDSPKVGGCLAGELSVSIIHPQENIPRMAKVEPFVRVKAGNQTSEWIPQGKFFIDTRETTRNNDGLPILSLHCYDAMLKAEADYPNTTHDWPMSDIDVVNEIAMTMGLQTSVEEPDGIDTRTITAVSNGYQIGLPAGQTMREVLSNIAAMYGGNWIMNYDGQLLLIKITDLPPETNYLVTIAGDPITFGGDRILV